MNADQLTMSFIERATTKHGDKYDYSGVKSINTKTEVAIICRVHGMFLQTPERHLIGRGCQLCGVEARANQRRTSIDQFIEKAKAAHGNVYDYSRSNYSNTDTDIEIICPKHGSFFQTPKWHILGRGCRMCSNSTKPGRFNNSSCAPTTKLGQSVGQLYFITGQFTSGQKFLKVGMTASTDLKSRLRSFPFDKQLLTSVTGKVYQIFQLENSILEQLKSHQFVPEELFGGHTECLSYSEDNIQCVQKVIAEFCCENGLTINPPF